MSKKQLSVGVPATLNLKAELERARQECKEDSSAAKRRKASSLALGIGGRNRGVSDRAQRDKRALDDERLSHSFANARARQILEEKAKLYDLLSTAGDSASSLSASQLDDPRIAQILEEGSVDFVTKQLAFLRRRNAPQEGSSATGSAANSPGLIEVVDEFGRSRMVPQSEAHEYCQRSRATAGSNSDDYSGDTSSSSSSGNEQF
ncbi:hypothetical protein IWW39_003261 [Coemansia spiralis]|uniref:Uncharacterized protein n=1 Tax=Coemansia spiralis TaxID=417178 RepID=A0A9W8L4T7_9FUNG|nr:hypothetical protein IWW39_003261 [Coemansia spiralis]